MANPPAPAPPAPTTKPLIHELRGPLFKMAVPEGWTDRSIYGAALPVMVENMQPSLVVTQENAPGIKDFETFFKGLVLEVEGQLPEYKEQKREKRAAGGHAAQYLEYTWKSPAGVVLRQAQWYAYKDPVVYILTATAPDSGFEGLRAQFDATVKGFSALEKPKKN
jgi:hypothetical protein